jgi:hypothetical protein
MQSTNKVFRYQVMKNVENKRKEILNSECAVNKQSINVRKISNVLNLVHHLYN